MSQVESIHQYILLHLLKWIGYETSVRTNSLSICVYTEVNKHTHMSFLCHLRWARSNDTSVTMSIHNDLCFPVVCLPLTMVVNNYLIL